MEKSPFIPRILISIPTRGSTPWEFWATLGELHKPPGTRISVEPRFFQIDEARNAQVEKFEKHKEFTHHFWLDDDLCMFDPNVLMRLVQDNQPIVSGLYWRQEWPHYPILLQEHGVGEDVLYDYAYSDTPYPKDKMVQVDAVGCGMLLVKREVYEKIEAPRFLWHGDLKHLHGEDMYFSRKARRAGYPIYVDTRARALHVARTPIGSEEDKWTWFKRRHPPDTKKIARINKALESLRADRLSSLEPTALAGGVQGNGEIGEENA